MLAMCDYFPRDQSVLILALAYQRPQHDAGDGTEKPIRSRPDAVSFIMKRCQALIQPGMDAYVLIGQGQPVTRARPRPTRQHGNLPECKRGLSILKGFAEGLAEMLVQAM